MISRRPPYVRDTPRKRDHMARQWLLAAVVIVLFGAAPLAAQTADSAASPGYCSCLQGFKEAPCSRSLQTLCQTDDQPFCRDLGRFVNTSDVAAGQVVAQHLKDRCGWQVPAEGTSPCDCLQDLRAPACVAAAYVQCLAGSTLCPALVLGRQAEAFSRLAYAAYLKSNCTDRFSTQQLAMNFTGMTSQQFTADAENGTLNALSNITGVPRIFINSTAIDLAAPPGNGSSNSGRKLLQDTPTPVTSVQYLIRSPAAEGPAVQERLEGALKDDAAGLYESMQAAGVTAQPSVSLNGGPPVGGPKTDPAPASPPTSDAAQPPPAPSVGLIVGAVLGSVLGGALLVCCVCAGLRAKKGARRSGKTQGSGGTAGLEAGAAHPAAVATAAAGGKKAGGKEPRVKSDTEPVRDAAQQEHQQHWQQQDATPQLQPGQPAYPSSTSNSGVPARLDKTFAPPMDVLPVRGIAQPSTIHMLADAPVAEPPNPAAANSVSTSALTTQHLRALPGSTLALGPCDNSSEMVTGLNASSLSGFVVGSPLDAPGDDISQPTSSILVFPDKPGGARHSTSEQSSLQLQQQASSSLQAGQKPKGRAPSLDQPPSMSSVFATTDNLM